MAANTFIAPSTALDRRQLGKYEVLCRLSTGGMSAIYLAHQTGLAGFKKLVVLKTILPDIGGEEDFVGMFLEEARITAVFNHPNIAQVFELDTDDGQLYMAMEFVQGCTLVEMARACRQARENIPVGFTLSAVRDTALALHYAHTFTDARGRRQIVIHRDVAEKNIMVTYEGVTKLLDFGIAKALGRSGRTSIGMVKGTSGYMSPEQIRGEPLDPRSDIFSLGVVLHECLTGLRLFHGKTAEEGMMAALREDVQPPSRWNKEVTPELDAVVLKALQRDRDQRFSTALELARAIERAAPGALWHPEQSGEVVTRFFAERRAETRRLLESAEHGSENTGEVRVQNVMAKVRAGAAPSAPEPIKPVDTPRRQSLLTAPKVSMPKEDDGETRKAELPDAPELTPAHATPLPVASTGKPEMATSPARPKVIKPAPAPPPSSRITGVNTAPEPALHDDDDDEDASEKTIPAASLPEEIKNLRAQFAAKKAAAAGVVSGPPDAGEHTAVLPPKPSAQPVRSASPVQAPLVLRAAPPPVPDQQTGPELPDAASVLARDRVSTDKAVDPVKILAGARTTTGETQSITGQGEAMNWEDDDGAKTAIAAPGEVQQVIRRIQRQSRANMEAAEEEAEGGGRKVALIVALALLAVLAVLGILVLLDVLPFPGLQAPAPLPAPPEAPAAGAPPQ